MSKVKLDLQNKNDSELLTFSQQHIAAMDGNANFATPIPSTVDYQAIHDDYETKLDEANLAQAEAKEKMAIKDVARVTLEDALRQRGGYVDSASSGDTPKILSSRLSVRNGRVPVGSLSGPVDFLATMGDKEGEIDLVWSPLRGAKTYVIQHSEDVTPRVWTQKALVSRSKYTATGCTSGETCVFRIAGVGTAGQGPWSDESKKMSP